MKNTIHNNTGRNSFNAIGSEIELVDLDDFEYLDEDFLFEENEEQEVVFIDEDHLAVGFFVFYVLEDEIKFSGKLYLPEVLKALGNLGYFKRPRTGNTFIFIRDQSNIIKEVNECQIKDAFYTIFMKRDIRPLIFRVGGALMRLSAEAQHQAYLNNASKVFNTKFLEHLETHVKPVLEDEQDHTYFFFKNRIYIADNEGINTMEYSELNDKCVWEDHIIDSEMDYEEDFQGAHFATFIKNVSRNEQSRIDAFQTGIGYLLNNFNSPSRSQAVICYDEVPSALGEPNGGTGKGVFCKAIKELRNTYKLDGKNIRRDDKFKFQGITERTQIFWIDDAAENFPFEMLHSVITDGFTVEKKYQHQFYIPAEKSPKIVLCSNTILSQGGKTNIRRQFILEFSDFYSSRIITGAEEPIREVHGGLFFDNDSWDQAEWRKFYSYMIWCAQYYLQNGLKPYTQLGQERSRLIQTTDVPFASWVENTLSEPTGEYDTRDLFSQYAEYCGEANPSVTPRTFNRWLKVFAEFKGWELRSRETNGRTKIWFVSLG